MNGKCNKYQIKSMIDNARTLDQLHDVWGVIKRHNLHDDQWLMSWYDFKYNLIGNI